MLGLGVLVTGCVYRVAVVSSPTVPSGVLPIRRTRSRQRRPVRVWTPTSRAARATDQPESSNSKNRACAAGLLRARRAAVTKPCSTSIRRAVECATPTAFAAWSTEPVSTNTAVTRA